MPKARQLTPAAPVDALPGVGPERAAQLARLGVRTVEELLLHRPRRHEDRRRVSAIADLRLHEPAAVRGRVVALGVKRYRKGTKSVFELILDDGTARLHCRWWNLPFLENYFQAGDELFAFGKPCGLKPRTMDHPETEVVEAGEDSSIHLHRIVPVYPLTEGLPQRWLRSLVWRTLPMLAPQLEEPWPGVALAGLPARAEAIRRLHFPDSMAEVEQARQRLALDEFIQLQLALQQRRRRFETQARALPCGGDNRLIRPFLRQLGFQLTDAQTRVLRELRRDLSGPLPMRRLLQGDVGSGKTVVAACCALMTLESGCNAALMAPTEILAQQHFQTFRRWFEPLGVAVELHTGSTKTMPRAGRPAVAASPPVTRSGSPPATSDAEPPSLVIGTHALIETDFALERLGLVIIDEQHRFGVAQREKLVRKGHYPHLLVMTATPIPRTLGLTLYGDLDVSIIDALPPRRGRIQTFLRPADRLPKVLDFLRQKLGEGRQAYLVYPRVEDGGTGGIKAVTQEYERLQSCLAPWRVGLVHGRLSAREKQAVMDAFRRNEVQALLATSIVEVGVDVPNATVMVVENAEQFGLAQLHQLRGRIGRGAHDSFCILVADLKTPEARERLRVMEATADGFRIAEADLRLRGPGELLGREQSGLPAFRFGNLAEDLPLIERAREIARALVQPQPAPGNH
jgi:ATP-dependent DNA helicase RecG